MPLSNPILHRDTATHRQPALLVSPSMQPACKPRCNAGWQQPVMAPVTRSGVPCGAHRDRRRRVARAAAGGDAGAFWRSAGGASLLPAGRSAAPGEPLSGSSHTRLPHPATDRTPRSECAASCAAQHPPNSGADAAVGAGRAARSCRRSSTRTHDAASARCDGQRRSVADPRGQGGHRQGAGPADSKGQGATPAWPPSDCRMGSFACAPQPCRMATGWASAGPHGCGAC